MKPRRVRPEAGYTLIELIISLTLLAVITGALTAAFITTNNANANTSERIHESTDAQLTAGFWTADAQAAGGVNSSTGTTDSSLGVSISDDGGCGLGGGTLVTRFKWKEWVSRDSATTADTYTTRVANYVYRSGTRELERRTCANGASTGFSTLATRVASAPTTSCSPVDPCEGMPNTVTITVTETNDPATGPSPYTFTLTASVRPGAQSLPGSGNAAGSPLLALGSTTCSGGVTGLSVTGNATVVVNGQAAINATDVGGCSAMVASGSIQYSADGTSLVTGGTCTGNRCPPTTTDTTRLGNPFASLTPPAASCSGSGNPALIAGHYQPGTYRSAVTFNGILDPGTYVICNSVSFGTATGTGVFMYFTGSSAVNIAGGVNITLSAPLTGAYAGLLMWNDTTNAMTIGGNGSSKLYGGAIYSPKADVTLAGNADLYVGMIVAKRIIFSGTGITAITGGSSTPGAPALTATTSTTALRQVDLIWTTPAYTGAPGSPITGYEYRVDSGGGFGAWTTVPGGLVNTYAHTCGTSDTVATTCSYQVRALNALGNGSASNVAAAASFADGAAPAVTVTAPTAGTTVGRTAIFAGTAGNGAGDSATVTVRVYGSANCTGGFVQASATRTGTTWSVVMNGLTDGAKSVCAAQTDWVGNTGTSPPVTFAVAPVLGMTVTNANGRLAANDTVMITFGQAINPASICAGWNGTTTRTTLTVTVTNNDPTTGNNDSLTVADTGCTFNFGKIDLGSQGWVTATTNYAGGASTAVMNAGLTTLTIKVGTGTQGPNGNAATPMTYTPSTLITDALNSAMAGAFGFPGQRF